MSLKEKESNKVEKKVTPEKVEKAKPPTYKMESVTSKPERRYRKGSKYDAILDEFIKSPSKMVRIEIKDKQANYISSQLMKRLVARKLTETIDTSVVNNVSYLEKIDKTVSPTKV